jgi:hypothetical protein
MSGVFGGGSGRSSNILFRNHPWFCLRFVGRSGERVHRWYPFGMRFGGGMSCKARSTGWRRKKGRRSIVSGKLYRRRIGCTGLLVHASEGARAIVSGAAMTAIRRCSSGNCRAHTAPKHDEGLGGGNGRAEILLLRVPGGHGLHRTLGPGRNRHWEIYVSLGHGSVQF